VYGPREGPHRLCIRNGIDRYFPPLLGDCPFPACQHVFPSSKYLPQTAREVIFFWWSLKCFLWPSVSFWAVARLIPFSVKPPQIRVRIFRWCRFSPSPHMLFHFLPVSCVFFLTRPTRKQSTPCFFPEHPTQLRS